MKWLDLLRVFWADVQAWRCGLTRIVPRRACNGEVTRGRVYAPRARPHVTLHARHMTADGRTTDHYVEG